MKKRKKHKWKYQINIKKKIIVLVILGVSLFVGLGYALIQSGFNLGGIIEFGEVVPNPVADMRRKVSTTCTAKYTLPHLDSMNPALSTENIYYFDNPYKSNCDMNNMNNLVFDDKCWQIVRTTDTGGIKIIYNGEPEITEVDGDIQYVCGAYSLSDETTTYDLKYDSVFAKNYRRVVDGSTTRFELIDDPDVADDTYSVSLYSLSSDQLTTELEYIIENYPYTCTYSNKTCTNGSLKKILSRKSGTTVYVNQSAHKDNIGSSQYNTSTSSPANVGYKYGDIYNTSYKLYTTTIQPYNHITLTTGTSLSTSYWYADSIEWNNETNPNKYTLVNPYKVSSTDEYAGLIGKYTFRSDDDQYSSSSVYYIADVTESTMWYKTLSSGADISSYDMKFGDDISNNYDGTYSLTGNVSTGTIKDMSIHPSSYEGRYTCGNAQTSCQTPWYVYNVYDSGSIYGSNRYMWYMYGFITMSETRNGLQLVNPITIDFGKWYEGYNTTYANYRYTCGNSDTTCTAENLKYITMKDNVAYRYADNHYCGTSVIYEGGKYKLQDVHEIGDSLDETSMTDCRYVCPNYGETECTTVLAHIIPDGNLVSISDPNVTSLADVLDAMFTKNTNDSVIKKYLEDWYEAELKDTIYENKIDDVIYCNDRSYSTKSGYTFADIGWNDKSTLPDRYIARNILFNSLGGPSDLVCINETDSFSISNNKAKLKYPIGLITSYESNLYVNNNASDFWTMSPYSFAFTDSGYGTISARMKFYHFVDTTEAATTRSHTVRPVISLKKDVQYYKGNGTTTNPYVVIPNDGWNLTNRGSNIIDQKFEYWLDGERIVSGWHDLEDSSSSTNTYYFENGYMKTGWHEENNNKYYLSTFDDDNDGYVDGKKLTSETREIDSVNYTFDANGVCTNCQ